MTDDASSLGTMPDLDDSGLQSSDEDSFARAFDQEEWDAYQTTFDKDEEDSWSPPIQSTGDNPLVPQGCKELLMKPLYSTAVGSIHTTQDMHYLKLL